MRYVILREGREIPVEISEKPGGYRILLDGIPHEVDCLEVVPGLLSMLVGGDSYEVTVFKAGRDLYHAHLFDGMRPVRLVHPMALLTGGTGLRGADPGGTVAAAMPGKVVRVLADAGARVRAGQGLVVLEAMKMQNEVKSPADGTVLEMRVAEGQRVDSGQVLVVLAPEEKGS